MDVHWLQKQVIPNSEQNSLLVEVNGISRDEQKINKETITNRLCVRIITFCGTMLMAWLYEITDA